MIVGVAVGEVRPGYELWHPNREKAESVTTKFVLAFLMLATAALCALIAISGFSLMTGGGGHGRRLPDLRRALRLLRASSSLRWSRGILPVAAALSMILAIFCAVGANSWFARDKAGFEDGLLPVTLIGLLVSSSPLLQIVLIAACALRLQPGLARRGGAPDRLRRRLRRRRPARERRRPAARLESPRSPSPGLDAGGGTRTHKPVRAIDFESIAYASSATPAPRQHRARGQLTTRTSCAGMRVHHLNCGTSCPHGRAAARTARAGCLEPARMVCHCLLIETDDGLVLVDTGFGDRGRPQPAASSAPSAKLISGPAEHRGRRR